MKLGQWIFSHLESIGISNVFAVEINHHTGAWEYLRRIETIEGRSTIGTEFDGSMIDYVGQEASYVINKGLKRGLLV